jgi:hypothetical protein
MENLIRKTCSGADLSLKTSDVGYCGKQPDVGNYFILNSSCKNHAVVRMRRFKVQDAFCKSPGLTFPKNAIHETENINFELKLKAVEKLLGLPAHALEPFGCLCAAISIWFPRSVRL